MRISWLKVASFVAASNCFYTRFLIMHIECLFRITIVVFLLRISRSYDALALFVGQNIVHRQRLYFSRDHVI